MMQTRAQELAALQAQNPPPTNNPDIQATPAIPDNDDEDDNTPAAAEGRRFAKILTSALSETITQALTAARATAAPNPAKYPKAKDPGMFNGRKRRYLRTWIGENEICFWTAPHLYRAETSKVMFAGSFLEGDAKT